MSAADWSEPHVSRPSITPGYGISSSPEGMLSWDVVPEQVTRARNYWVATTGPDGRPHVMPVWGLWLDESFCFSTDPASRKGRNLSTDSRLVIHLESGDDAVIIEGRAERVADASLLLRFVDAYDAKYGFRPDLSDPNQAVFRVRPKVVFAWREKDYPQSATRWRFPPDTA